jgi:hypothetical protein
MLPRRVGRRPGGSAATLPPPDAAQAVLDANKSKLQVPGATKAYVGWHFENNWITRQRAIVVLARRPELSAVQNRLPANLSGVPIDVRPDPRPVRPSPAATAGILMAAQPGTVREEEAVPEVPGQVVLEQAQPTLAGLAAARKPHVAYVPPPGVTLDPITAKMTLVLHVSPEQGWTQLQNFFRGIAKDLVVGMYEFTAPHIESALIEALGSLDKLTLTLDSPPEPPNKREQTVETTRNDLAAALKQRLSFAWALAGLGHEAPAQTFPTSYHIKVAVKDGKVFWLSSGNWNTSNQPQVDPSDQAALIDAAHTHDRDWHVICECPELAELFRTYLLQDYAAANKAAASATAPVVAMAAGASPAMAEQQALAVIAAHTPKTFFPAHTITGTIKVKPLLTPDDYRKPILELIKGAKQRFYMQTQYIHTVPAAQDKGNPTHRALIKAVADLINAGVDVRLITSEFENQMWIEQLQDAGVDAVEHLRIQPHVHNKGIVVDSQIVVVSSQNWSALGTGNNRDAGLIIYNADAARYFEEIFLHDWVNMAAAKVLR